MSNITNLDLNLLKGLNALLDERNVSRAAEKLALTQPAVSRILAKLRHHFKDPLFVRAPQGLIPTERALALAPTVKRILADIEQLIMPAEFEPSQLQRTFKIAATDNGTRSIGLPLMQRLQEIAPQVKLAFVAAQGRNLEQMLSKGELDLVIVAESAMPENLRAKVLYREEYVCVMHKNNPYAHQSLDLTLFCQLKHLLVSYWGGNFSGATDKALAKLGLQREVVMSVNNFLLLPDMLRHSDCIAVAPSHLIQPYDELIIQPPPLAIEGYNKLMGWHERSQQDRVHQWLRGEIEQVVLNFKDIRG